MNCQRFQDDLYEFLDGTLSPRDQAAIEKHLAECDACRQAAQQQRQLAQTLSQALRSSTESLQLSPAVQHRVLAALGDTPAPRHPLPAIYLLWRCLAWPVAITACLILATVMTAEFLRRTHAPGRLTAHLQPHDASPAAFIHLTYSVPVYTFRRENSHVVDALTPQVAVVNATFPADQDPKPVRHGKDRKYPL